MNLKTDFGVLASVVEKISPLVASILGTPAAGIIFSLLGNIFGDSNTSVSELANKISLDPNAQIKIKALELQHGEILEKISQENYAMEINDRSSARKMNEINKDWIVHALAIIYTIGFLLYALSSYIPNSGFDKGIFHDLLNVSMLILSFYFGSSYQSNK